MKTMMEAGKMFLEAAGGSVLGSTCDFFLESIEDCAVVDVEVHDKVEYTLETLDVCIPKIKDRIMTLGGRQDELKELEEEMRVGRKLLNESKEGTYLSLFKRRDCNNKLAASYLSLKSLVKKLRLQLATSVFVSTNENTEVVKGTKRKLDELSETVKAKFSEMQKRQEGLENVMNKLERKEFSDQVGASLDGAAVVAALGKLDDLALRMKGLTAEEIWWESYVDGIFRKTQQIKSQFQRPTPENDYLDWSRIRSDELTDIRMSLEGGVDLLRNIHKVAEWTDELKSEYINKFHELEATLEALHNRVAAMRPLKWRCGKCDNSSGTNLWLTQHVAGSSH